LKKFKMRVAEKEKKFLNSKEELVGWTHSIKWRLVALLIAILGGVILLCTVINSLFLEKYYERMKVDKLGDSFKNINETFDGSTTDELTLAYDQLGSDSNVTLYIFDKYVMTTGIVLEVKYPQNMNSRDSDLLKKEIMFYYYPDKADYPDFLDSIDSASLTDIPSKAGVEKKSVDRGNKRIISNDQYMIYRRFDERLEANYLELFGTLNSGDSVFLRTNYDNISESAGIANRFFMYVGLIGTLIGAIAMYMTGNSFTRPLKKLTRITKDISKLDFDVRYEDRRSDEIGVLGESINALSGKLEQTISELKSANNELKSDIEKKQQIDDMRREFLSDVTHELKTPIALIQGYAEGLKDNISTDEESRNFYCDVIIDESVKMNNMVKKLLTLSHIESGSEKVEFQRFDIIELIDGVIKSMAVMFQNNDVKLDMEELQPVYVWADEYRIEEVVTNFISNALNHATLQPGYDSKTVRITVVNKDEKARVSVFNTGEKIPDESINRIWDKFYKVDKARTREYGGSGIGLSIVKAIMESMNQNYGVINHNDGVEFWFELDKKSI